MALLLVQAFASGCTALTGVEAISNGVPSFRKPKVRNAATCGCPKPIHISCDVLVFV